MFVVHGTDLEAPSSRTGSHWMPSRSRRCADATERGAVSGGHTRPAGRDAPGSCDSAHRLPRPWLNDPDDAFEAVGARLLSLERGADIAAPASITATAATPVLPRARAPHPPGGSVAALDDLVVTVGPFRSFDCVNAFQDAVRALDGVYASGRPVPPRIAAPEGAVLGHRFAGTPASPARGLWGDHHYRAGRGHGRRVAARVIPRRG